MLHSLHKQRGNATKKLVISDLEEVFDNILVEEQEYTKFYRQNMGVQRVNAVRKYGIFVYTISIGKLCHRLNYKYKNTFHHNQYCDQSRFQGISIYIFKKSLSIKNEQIAPVFF